MASGFIFRGQEEDKTIMSASATTASKKLLTTRNITRIAILSAIAYVLMLIEFPLPIAPSFYKLDFSEAAVLIGGFAMGPAAAAAIEAIKVPRPPTFTASKSIAPFSVKPLSSRAAGTLLIT